MKYGKKRLLIILLALCMVLTMLPASTLAAEGDSEALSSVNEATSFSEESTDVTVDESLDEPADSEDELISNPADQTEETADAVNQETVTVDGETQTYIPDYEDLPDNDELFAGYVEREFYGENGIAPLGVYGEESLTGLDAKIYAALKTKIGAVANGEASSTQFTLTWAELGITKTSWTKDELGVSTVISNNAFTQEAKDAILSKVAFNWKTIVACLREDCPYELYWYDKTKGTSYNIGGLRGTSEKITLAGDPTFSFNVAGAYASSGESYITDLSKTGAASKAATTAQQCVIANEGKSDYEKLIAYRDYICSEVSYNTEAASDSYTGGYGDPWQLIYVFDGNPDTNVVCEGYSKAFQYLCDLSNFTNTVCYSVTGIMTSDTGEGPHMWNIVTLGGKNYLVDVTNSDEGSVGQYGGLFLVGAPDGTAAGYKITVPGHTFDNGSYTKDTSITYTYDDDTTSLYSDDILTLASEDYTGGTEEDSIGANLYGHSLSLSGNIGVNFYMEFSQDVLNDNGAYMQFTLPGVNHTDEKVLVQDAEKTEVDGKTYYVFPCGVAAKDMTGEIKAQIVLSDGRKGEEYTYSVKEYADCILDNPTQYASDTTSAANLENLVKALLNYGGCTQSYFGTNLDNLANTGLILALPESSTVLTALGENYKSVETGSAEGLNYYGTSLMLTTKTGIRHYFTLEDGNEIGEYTFTFNGETLNPTQKGNYYYVEIQNISAEKLNSMYNLQVAKNNDSSSAYSLQYGVYTYVEKVLEKESDEIYLNLMKSLYQYGESANNFLIQ